MASRSSSSRGSPAMMGAPMLLLLLLCLLCTTVQAASSVLGLDFGTEYIKATLVKPGIPLEIVLTKDTRRKEAATVAFKPVKGAKADSFPERLYGSDASALAARFPAEVFPNLKALLGLPADNSKVTEYVSRHPSLILERDETRDTVAFRSAIFGPEEKPWTIEEMIAMELQSIQKNAEALAGKGSTVKDVVITVPQYFGLEERRAIALAADLAGLRVLSLISDGLAVGVNYATSRTFPSINEGGKAEHHLIFDMGAGSMTASVLRFQGRTVKDVGKYNKTVQEVQVVGTAWDRTLGGDALNAVIMDDMLAQFVDTKKAKAASISSEDVMRNGRAAAKLWKEAERLRQVLSANTETQAGFEGLHDDVDFKYKLSRTRFEELTSSYTEKILPAVETACDNANIKIEDLESMILHGGSVRTPFIQKELERIMGGSDRIRSNVNADEAAVFGAGFRGATLSPSFRVKEIRTSEAAGYPIGMKWTNVHKKPQHQIIFPATSHLGNEKTLSFQNQEDFTVLFYQHIKALENVSPGSDEKEISALTTKNLSVAVTDLKSKGCTDGDILLKIGLKLSAEDGEVGITRASLQCEFEEEEKKDSVVDSVKGLFGFGSKKEGQEVLEDVDPVDATGSDTSTISSTSTAKASSSSALSSGAVKDTTPKLTKRTHTINIDYDYELRGYPRLPGAELTRMKERLAAFADSDRSRRLREEALNQLEGFTYRARDMVDDESFISASTAAERASLTEKAKAASDWLYEGGADATREELRTRLNEMKDIVAPIDKRRDEAKKRPEQVRILQEALNQTMGFMDSVKGQIEVAAQAALSSSTSTSTTTATAEASSTTAEEFEGLEDEETPSISSARPVETPPMPTYRESDLVPVQEMYDSVTTWLTSKLAEQEALPPTADPVLLVKDIAAKADQLQKAGMELIMKAVKMPVKPTSSKSKSSKTKKAKKTKSAGAEASATAKAGVKKGKIGLGDDDVPDGFGGMPFLKMGEDGEMPSEEEILAAIRRNQPPGDEEETGHVVDEL